MKKILLSIVLSFIITISVISAKSRRTESNLHAPHTFIRGTAVISSENFMYDTINGEVFRFDSIASHNSTGYDSIIVYHKKKDTYGKRTFHTKSLMVNLMTMRSWKNNYKQLLNNY